MFRFGYRFRIGIFPAPAPDNPHLRPEGRDLGPEESHTFVSLQLGQHAVLTLPVVTGRTGLPLMCSQPPTANRYHLTFAPLHRPQADLHFCANRASGLLGCP